MITDNPTEHTETMTLVRIISRHDWDELQRWHKACPGATIEHLYAGLFVLTMPAGGVRERAA